MKAEPFLSFKMLWLYLAALSRSESSETPAAACMPCSTDARILCSFVTTPRALVVRADKDAVVTLTSSSRY